MLAFSVPVLSEMDTIFGLLSPNLTPMAPVRSVTRRSYLRPCSWMPVSVSVRRFALMFSGENILSIWARDAVPGTVSAESPPAARLSASMAWSRSAVVFATASTCRKSGAFSAGLVLRSFLTVGASLSVFGSGAPGSKPLPGSESKVELSDTQRLTGPLMA